MSYVEENVHATVPGTPPGESVLPEADRGFLRLLRDAVRGTREDYTRGPIGRALFLLAVPMVLETAMESVFALADVFWVSRLGSAAITTVGLTESLLMIVYTLAIGLSVGATATVARRVGERDAEGAAIAASQVVFLGLAVSAALALVGAPFAGDLLRLMGADDAVVRDGTGYARILLAGNGVIMLLFLLNAVFRGAGDAAIAMRVLWLANGINLVLDPALIFGWGPLPALGLEGAAIATTIGRGTAVCVQLLTLARGGEHLRVAARHVRLAPEVLGRLVRLSLTGTFQFFVSTASWIVLIRILSTYGTEVIAGYTIAMRLVMFALLPAWGLSNAAATMVGQGLGAGRPERAVRATRLAGLWNMACLGAVGVVFFLFAPAITGWFASDAESLRWGAEGLRVVALGFPFYAWGMVLTQAFNGAGDAWTPTWINLACFWGLEQSLAWSLSRTAGMGPTGVFVAVAISYSVLAVVAAVLFRRGRWKRARV